MLVEEFEAVDDAGDAFVGFVRESMRRQATNQGFLDVVAQRLGSAALTSEQRRRFVHAMGKPLGARRRPARSATTSCPRTSR